MNRLSFTAVTLTLLVMASWLPVLADAAEPPGTEAVAALMSKEMIGASGKELKMLTVEYRPGGASKPHQHHAQVFVYVLSGTVRMQVQGSAVVTLKAGETFYEGPDDVHTVSANASNTEPAKILVFMVKDKSAPATTPAKSQ
jgi:quercetin dioxygenase-like cupin family protein